MPTQRDPVQRPMLFSRSALRLPSLVALLTLAGCFTTEGRVDSKTRLEIHRETAVTYFETGDLDRAEDQALRGLEVDRRDKPLRLVLGWVNLRRGDTQSLYRARSVFEDMRDEKDFRAWLGLAESLERLGVVHEQTADDLESGKKLPERDRDREIADLRREAQKLWKRSNAQFERVLEDQPDHIKALNGLQRTWSQLGDYEKSLEYSARLIEITTLEVAEIQRRIQDPNGGGVDSRRTNLFELERETVDLLTDTHLFAQSVNLALGRPAAAIEHLDAVLELRPDVVKPYARRGQLRFDAGDYAGAVEDITVFLRRSDEPYESADIQRAWDLRREAEQRLAVSGR